MTLKKEIIEVLKTCYDPEIPLDLWSLGLIYEINILDDDKTKKDVHIKMSLTTPGCNMGQSMVDNIKEKVDTLHQVNQIEVTITFDPPWNPEMMTNEARNTLGFDSINETKNNQKIKTEWE